MVVTQGSRTTNRGPTRCPLCGCLCKLGPSWVGAYPGQKSAVLNTFTYRICKGARQQDCLEIQVWLVACAYYTNCITERADTHAAAPRILALVFGICCLRSGCSWLLLAALGCSLLLLAALGCSWLLLAALGCSWLLLAAAPGCSWLLLAPLGCSRLLRIAPCAPTMRADNARRQCAPTMRADNARRQYEHSAPTMRTHNAGVTRQGPQMAARMRREQWRRRSPHPSATSPEPSHLNPT